MATENVITCDIRDCVAYAASHQLSYLKVDIVPTGNSDYSAYKETKVKTEKIDLCNYHFQQYMEFMKLELDEYGLSFKLSNPQSEENADE